jgi:hypothetical protein
MPSSAQTATSQRKAPQVRLVIGEYSYTLHFGRFMRAHAAALCDDGSMDWMEINGSDCDPEVRRTLDRAFTSALFHDTEEALVDEYTEWCAAAGIPLISADEQDLEQMTTEQRRYIHGFILRWERAMGQQDSPAGCFSYEAWGRGLLVAAAA